MAKDLQLQFAVRVAAYFVVALWLVKIIEIVFSWRLVHWGVYPQSVIGLRGIILAPFIHGSPQHVFANTLPMLILGTALLYGYPRARWWTIINIWLVSGIGVWLFARPSFHFGASGLAHGMFFFLFVVGILRRDKRAIALLMIAFFMYGGMLMTIFPREPDISFEAHFFGALGGVISAFMFRNMDTVPARRPYSWELEPDDEEDSLIGDAWMVEKQSIDQEHMQASDLDSEKPPNVQSEPRH